MKYNLTITKFFYSIFIVLCLFITSYQDNKLFFTSPNSLTLLDNSIAIVADNGIHFYNKDLTIDSNNIPLEVTVNDLNKIAMAQFPEIYGSYILILVKDNLYIFDQNKGLIKNSNIASIINGTHYDIIPYKKDNNILHFIISYVETNKIVLSIFSFNLNNIYSE